MIPGIGAEGILAQHLHRPPASPLEYVLVAIAVVAAAYALVLAVTWTFRPGETDPHHIKRAILEDEPPPTEKVPGAEP